MENQKKKLIHFLDTKTMEKHNKLIDILVKYGNEEFGDNIIDEISELFNYPKTKEIND